MNRSLACALLLGTTLASSLASAQTVVVVVEPPPPPVIVIVEPPPPPPVIVVVEPPPPPQVVIVEEAPAEPSPPPLPSPAPSGPGPRFVLDLNGDMLVGAGYDVAALGGSVRPGLTFGGGWTGLLALGYASALGGSSEVNLGIEVQRDFSPTDSAGFLLLARLGTAFLLDTRDAFDAGIRLSGQIGVGGRFDVSDQIAILVDARGVLRFRPDAPFGPSSNDLDAGLQLSMGLRVRL